MVLSNKVLLIFFGRSNLKGAKEIGDFFKVLNFSKLSNFCFVWSITGGLSSLSFLFISSVIFLLTFVWSVKLFPPEY